MLLEGLPDQLAWANVAAVLDLRHTDLLRPEQPQFVLGLPRPIVRTIYLNHDFV